MKKPEHIHKYMRVELGDKGFTVFKCMWPNCKHYLRTELVVGRASVCWKCGDEMILNTANMVNKKPHHPWCTRQYTRRTEQLSTTSLEMGFYGDPKGE